MLAIPLFSIKCPLLTSLVPRPFNISLESLEKLASHCSIRDPHQNYKPCNEVLLYSYKLQSADKQWIQGKITRLMEVYCASKFNDLYGQPHIYDHMVLPSSVSPFWAASISISFAWNATTLGVRLFISPSIPTG